MAKTGPGGFRTKGWAKKWRKAARRERLCRNKRINFSKRDVVLDFDFDIVDKWCTKELNGAFYWYRGHWYWNDMGNATIYDIGFQDETDMLAFTLRWLGK